MEDKKDPTEWARAYNDTIVRFFTHYTGERPVRRGLLRAGQTMGSIHIDGEVQCRATDSQGAQNNGATWASKNLLSPLLFRFIAHESVTFEVSGGDRFDHGCVPLVFCQKGQEVAMTQDELDWARYWSKEGGQVVGLEPQLAYARNVFEGPKGGIER